MNRLHLAGKSPKSRGLIVEVCQKKSKFDDQNGHGLEEELEPISSTQESERSNGWIVENHAKKI